MSVLERLKVVNQRAAPEESLALRAAVLLAVVIAAVAVLQQDVGGPLLHLGVLVGIPGGFAFSHVARHRDGFWLKMGLAAALLVVFLDFLGAVTGIGAGTIAEVQIPLAELFLWVQLLHAMDVPARRDLMFSLVSSLVLMAVAGVLSISLGFGLLLALWGLAALASLVLAHRSELRELRPLAPAPVETPTVALRTLVRPLSLVCGVVVVVGAAVFGLLPAAGSARALTFPSELPESVPTGGLPGSLSNPTLGDDDPGQASSGRRKGKGRASFGYFGFANELDTAVRGRPDNTLVMRVRASAPDLWRGQSFDRWDGRRWTVRDEKPTPIRGSKPIDLPLGPEDVAASAGRDFVQTFYLEGQGPNLVFGAYAPTQLYFPDNTVFQLSDGTIRSGVELEDGAVYTVVSKRPPITADILRASDELAPKLPRELAERYLQLPEVPERVRRLAAEVTASAPTRYDKVKALTAWMGANTEYSLDIPPLPAGADATEHFLFEERRGFCEQIGTSLVVMLRSLGVPARLAVGYAPGERNPFTGLFDVRASDAHSWAEVYFDGIGWQSFDPTAVVPLAGDGGLRASSGISSFLAARLPAIPAAAPRVLGALALVAVAAVAVGRIRARRVAQRAAAARPWPERWQADLDRLGAARGRPRREGESVREYVEVLRHGLAPHPSWQDAVATLEWEAYSPVPGPRERREAADELLASLSDGRRAEAVPASSS